MKKNASEKHELKILVVDDDAAIVALVSDVLASADMEAVACTSAIEAIDKIVREKPDLALLDVMMPGMDGFELCTRIRRASSIPIVFLTAKDAESDLVVGLTLGADDYKKGLAARVVAPQGGTLRVDPDKMARALGNVVRNAIAYADVGTVVGLSARRVEGAGWEIAVSDRGREIAPEHLESVFDRFFREDAARTHEGNAGLGLAIAREIVQAHGGSVRADSKDGFTIFTLELP